MNSLFKYQAPERSGFSVLYAGKMYVAVYIVYVTLPRKNAILKPAFLTIGVARKLPNVQTKY